MRDRHAPVREGEILLGKYRIERVLGRGGMGVVVAARHLSLDELFAVKFLLPDALGDPQAVGRFLREARAAARLRSEHAARVIDVGQLENGAPYMIMEHLAGTDLRKLVRRSGPLPVNEAALYVLQACEAIAEAHSLGIVHRDIKPSNLYLTRRPNGSPCVKVLDFGISKSTAPDGVELTETGMMVGSPLYMSPEQMARSRSADARSDIWSMGVVLYELVTGTTPFAAEGAVEVIARVLQEEAAPPSSFRPDLPPWLDAVVLSCLRRSKEQRFQRIEDLAAALRAGGAGAAPLSLPGRQPSLPDSAQPLSAQPLSAQPLSMDRWLVPGGVPLADAPASLSDTRSSPGAAETLSARTTAAWHRTGHRAAGRRLPVGVAVAAVLGVVGLVGAGMVTIRYATEDDPGSAEPSPPPATSGIPAVLSSAVEPPSPSAPGAPASGEAPAAPAASAPASAPLPSGAPTSPTAGSRPTAASPPAGWKPPPRPVKPVSPPRDHEPLD